MVVGALEQSMKFPRIMTRLEMRYKLKKIFSCFEEKEINSLSRQIYLLYESAVSESHLHQEDWPIKETKQLCAQIID